MIRRFSMWQRLIAAAAISLVFLVALLLWLLRPDVARESVDAVSGTDPAITAPRAQIIPTMKVAQAVGWSSGSAPIPAAGLTVAAFARGLTHPRWLYRLPNGDILVAESAAPPEPASNGGIKDWVEARTMKKAGADVPSPDRITLLRDVNGDGIADLRTILISGIHSPYGMALLGSYLYIGATDALVRVPFTVGMTRITAKPETIVRLPSGGHWARNIIPSRDGHSILVGVGSASNIAENGMPAEKGRAAILEVNLTTRSVRVFADGLRNPNGMAFEPHTGRLWVVVNERDMLGSDLVPDYMTRVASGDDFGWPWRYWGSYRDERVRWPQPAARQSVTRPDYALGPHTASLGLAFSNDARLGARFTDGAFVGQHGSWNREPPSGYKVVFVPFGKDGMPKSGNKPIDVLTGFLDAKGQAQGRPVGVITSMNGSLLVADDVGNIIWRVSCATCL